MRVAEDPGPVLGPSDDLDAPLWSAVGPHVLDGVGHDQIDQARPARGAGEASSDSMRESVEQVIDDAADPEGLVVDAPGQALGAPTSGSRASATNVSASRPSAPMGVLSSWLTLATKSRRTSSTRRLSLWSSARTRTSPLAAHVPAEGRDPDREAGQVAADAAAGRDLELALADLTVPAHLPGQGQQLAGHQALALDQAERSRGVAGLQDAVLGCPAPRPRRTARKGRTRCRAEVLRRPGRWFAATRR